MVLRYSIYGVVIKDTSAALFQLQFLDTVCEHGSSWGLEIINCIGVKGVLRSSLCFFGMPPKPDEYQSLSGRLCY